MWLLSNKREIIWLVLLPCFFQMLLPKFWFDPFLIMLFYLAWNEKIFPSFIFILIWGIMKSLITGENPGAEIISLMAVWYYLNFFSFKSISDKIISIITGSFIFLFVMIFLFHANSIWGVSMFFKFLFCFILINLLVCWIIGNIRGFFRTNLEHQWKIV